ncbi:MAG: glycosyltransferase [Actinobacteria bacterium]|nr:MAG: glycosyltransferase [Actinomycetota bacterium]
MKATVVMCSYGYARWIAEAVDSVLDQDPPAGGFELVIVHRPSGDGTEEVLARYAGDQRVRVLAQSGTGLPQAANQGLAAAAGDYVMRLDADDVLLPGTLHAECGALDAHPGIGFVYGDAVYLFEDTGRRARKPLPPYDPDELASRGEFLTGATTWRRDVLESLGGFDESLPTLEGYDLSLRMLDAGVMGIHLDMPAFEYRIHGASMSDETELVRTTAEAIAARHGRVYERNANHPREYPS